MTVELCKKCPVEQETLILELFEMLSYAHKNLDELLECLSDTQVDSIYRLREMEELVDKTMVRLYGEAK